MQQISQYISNLITKLYKNDPIMLALINNWAKIIGNDFYQQSQPIKIVYMKEKNIKIRLLYISAINPSVSLALSYRTGIIIERIAVYLGYKAVHKVKIMIHNSRVIK